MLDSRLAANAVSGGGKGPYRLGIAIVLVLWTGGVGFDEPHNLDEHSMMLLARTSASPHNSDASHI